MDDRRFDALTRALAAGANRRALLKAAVAATAGTLLPFGRGRRTRAAALCGASCDGSRAACLASDDGCFACCGADVGVLGLCVNTDADPANCGACGAACAAGESCQAGACVLLCPAGQTACAGVCVDPQTDPANCLGCGNVCPAGQACCGDLGCLDLSSDLHHCGSCATDCGGGRCCAAVCVDPQVDPANCGDCGAVCPAGQSCQAGACAAACPPGQTPCAAACVDLATDAGNCGACGTACPTGQTCANGACLRACPAGQTACGGSCVDLATDPANCGACGTTCAAGQGCRGGGCVAAGACAPGQVLCAGACVDVQADAENCGTCGAACPAGQVCASGVCGATCSSGTTLCGTVCADVTSDQNNCGACGVVCDRSTPCRNGTCVRPDCPANQTRCQDGCVDLASDASHCGGCSNVCLNGNFACCGGACADLKTDAGHCGSCGRACPPGYRCEAGACVLRSSSTGIVSGRRTASPDFCVTKARTQAEIDALFSAGGLVTPTPQPSSKLSWKEIATGSRTKVKAASAQLAQTIADAVVQVSACGSAGDPARQTALMTDAMARAWLAERGYRPDELAALGQATPAALPPQSWERIAAIDQVFALGGDLASALVAYEPLAPTLAPRREIHIFKKHGDRWLLGDVRPADQATAGDGTGSVLARLFDCPAGVSASDPGDACAPAPELQFGYALVSETGSIQKGAADAAYDGPGLLQWRGLAPGRYRLRVAYPSGIGLSLVVAGADKTPRGDYGFTVPASGAPTRLDLYHERTVLTDALFALLPAPACPPCHRPDLLRQICIPTCPPCSACRTLEIGSGRFVSSCRSICSGDEVCGSGRGGACCLPVGGACASDRECCGFSCKNGVCSCAAEGAACANRADDRLSGCCPGARCAERIVGAATTTPTAGAGPSPSPSPSPSPASASPTSTCVGCKPVGATCAASWECCDLACAKGVCQCCAGADNGVFAMAALCCAYPQAMLVMPDSQFGPGFSRCCLLGVDCGGDPDGPPVVRGAPVLWAEGYPQVCG